MGEEKLSKKTRPWRGSIPGKSLRKEEYFVGLNKGNQTYFTDFLKKFKVGRSEMEKGQEESCTHLLNRLREKGGVRRGKKLTSGTGGIGKGVRGKWVTGREETHRGRKNQDRGYTV